MIRRPEFRGIVVPRTAAQFWLVLSKAVVITIFDKFGYSTVTSNQRVLIVADQAELDHGVLIERSMPDYIHSYIQLRLGYLLVSLFASNPKYSVYSEPRIRVRNDIVRLLDICVLDYWPAPNTAPTQPPIVAIEIVSEDDRYSEILRKLHEYHEWGVPHVWLIDPRSEQLAVYGANGFAQVEALTLPEFSFSVTLKELLPIE